MRVVITGATPSGLAALVIASVPLWVLLIRAALGDRPRPRAIASVGVGLAGVGVVIVAGSNVDARSSALAILITAAVLTALGAVLSNRLSMPSHAFVATTIEMLAAGAALTLSGFAAGEAGQLRIGALSTDSLAAFAYLVVFGSIGPTRRSSGSSTTPACRSWRPTRTSRPS